jgi:hypothetical protein
MNKKYFETKSGSLEEISTKIATEQPTITKEEPKIKLERKTYLENKPGSLEDAAAKVVSEGKELEEVLDEASPTIAKVKDIVKNKQAIKIDGTTVDLFTASAISQVYDKVNDVNKKKMDGMKIIPLANIAMKLLKNEYEHIEEEVLDEFTNFKSITFKPKGKYVSDGKYEIVYDGRKALVTKKQLNVWLQRKFIEEELSDVKEEISESPFAVSYSGTKTSDRKQRGANIITQKTGTIKVDAKDEDSAKKLVSKILDKRMNLRRYDIDRVRAEDFKTFGEGQQPGFAVRYLDPKNGKRFAVAYKIKKDADDKAAQLKKDGAKDISITKHTINFKEDREIAEGFEGHTLSFLKRKGFNVARFSYGKLLVPKSDVEDVKKLLKKETEKVNGDVTVMPNAIIGEAKEEVLDEGLQLSKLVGKSIAHLEMYVELANDIKKEYFKTNSQVSMFIKAKADQVLRSVPSLVKDLRKPGIWSEQVELDEVNESFKVGDKVKKEETMLEFTTQQIKQAYGILNDPRYKQGNYSGAVKAIEKLAKGLSKHKDVANALKRANESVIVDPKAKKETKKENNIHNKKSFEKLRNETKLVRLGDKGKTATGQKAAVIDLEPRAIPV